MKPSQQQGQESATSATFSGAFSTSMVQHQHTAGLTTSAGGGSGGGSATNRSGNSNSWDNNPKADAKDRYRSRVFFSRLVFLVCLAFVACALGGAAWWLLTKTENRMAREQFQAFTESAVDSAVKNANRQKLGLISLASVVEQALPDASEWPLVHLNGFRTISQNIIETSTKNFSSGMALMPIVTPEQLQEFEEYAYNVVMEGDGPVERMYGFDASYQKYNETDGSTYWDSPNRIFTPFYQHSKTDELWLMNWHSIEARGRLVDQMLECSKLRADEMRQNVDNANYVEPRECSVTTDVVDLYFRDPVELPCAVSVHPVYPANDNETMVGIITSAFVWEDTLVDVFSRQVSGVDCVLKTNTQSYTYDITDGRVSLKGAGDLHDRSFNDYAQEVVLSGPGLYSDFTPTYVLVAYPNAQLFDVYRTNNPTIAVVGSLCIILFISVIFFLYDFFVRTEFHHKEALSEARRQFVRYVSHEVRTPLNAVCMGLQLWRDEMATSTTTTATATADFAEKNDGGSGGAAGGGGGGGDGAGFGEDSKSEGAGRDDGDDEEARQKKHLEAIELQEGILSNAHRAVGVLNDLLQYDKVESGTLKLEMAVVPIFELVENAANEFRQPAKLKEIDYNLDYGPLLNNNNNNNNSDSDQQKAFDAVVSARELPPDVQNRHVIGDATRLTQVIRNLISNAIKFTPKGGNLSIRMVVSEPESAGKASEITLHSGEKASYLTGGTLRIEVTDTGAGMTPEQLKNLFKEGVQFDVNKLQGGSGSGLGLYIAKGILEQHGGSLVASSDGKGRGSTFTMSVPLYCVPEARSPEHEESQRTFDWDMMDPLNVLVVDDAALNRKLLSRLLRNHGNVCSEAENGRVAVQRVLDAKNRGDRFDVILMDYEMPEMDGGDAAKVLRAMGCDSFVVGITGNMFSEDVENFKSCGANSVLPKPLDLRALMDVLVENGVADTR